VCVCATQGSEMGWNCASKEYDVVIKIRVGVEI